MTRHHRARVIAALVAFAPLAPAQVVTRLVDPLATDPAIDEVELPNADGFPLDHFIATDPAAPDNGRLLVWLSGTGGAPAQYRAFATTAARLGYDVIGLTYDSWPSVNGFTLSSDDPTLPERIRRERLFGEDAFDQIEVDAANSVLNRLVRVLEHEAANHPGEDWAEYLTDSGGIVWRRVVVAGHSQGAGHALYLSKSYELSGALLLAGPGDFVKDFGTAPWVFDPQTTPAERLLGLTHLQDPGTPGFFTNQRIVGMEAFGPIQNVDGLATPQITSHMLTSAIEIDHANYHSAVIVDQYLPLDANGQSLYAPAWRSMLQRVGPGPCSRADLSVTGACLPGLGDAQVTLDDFSCFLALWSNEDPRADITTPGGCFPESAGDGVVGLADFACYLSLWSFGCP